MSKPDYVEELAWWYIVHLVASRPIGFEYRNLLSDRQRNALKLLVNMGSVCAKEYWDNEMKFEAWKKTQVLK